MKSLHITVLLLLLGIAASADQIALIGNSVDPLPSFLNGGMTWSIGNGTYRLATPFSTPAGGGIWTLTDFRAAVLVGGGTTVYFDIFSDSGGVPGSLIGSIGITPSQGDGCCQSFVYEATPNILLDSETQYWIVNGISFSQGSSAAWWLSTPPQYGTIATAWATVWTTEEYRVPAFTGTLQRGNHSHVPEPSTAALFLGSLGSLVTLRSVFRRRVKRVGDFPASPLR